MHRVALILGRVRGALTPGVERPGLRRLALASRLGRSRLSGGQGPVVSLTTHGPRLSFVHLTLESIARGALRPRRTILWVNDEAVCARPPAPLRRLIRRGLEVRLAENFGPHTKYYPYVEDAEAFTGPLVTADDDTIYPRSWLQGLAHAHDAHPDVISCYRARQMWFDGDRLAPYGTWQLVASDDASFLHFATGVSGAVYPVRMLTALRERGRAFVALCPAADDIWLNQTALTIGMPVRLVDGVSRDFPLVEETQADALWYSNWLGGRNDEQLAATYSARDLKGLLDAQAHTR